MPYKDDTGAPAWHSCLGVAVTARARRELLTCENVLTCDGEVSIRNEKTCFCTNTPRPSRPHQPLQPAGAMPHVVCAALLSCHLCQEDGCSLESVESKRPFFSDYRVCVLHLQHVLHLRSHYFLPLYRITTVRYTPSKGPRGVLGLQV